MNGAPRGSQNCGVASSDGDTQPTSSSMRANPAQPQTGGTADSYPQTSEISTSSQPSVPSALQQSQSLSLAGSSNSNLQGSAANTGSFPLLSQSVLQQPSGWNTIDLSSLYSPSALRFGRGVNQANSSGTVDSVATRSLLSGSSSAASASSLTGIPSSSGSFTNVVTLPSQAASQILQMLNAGIGSNILAQYQYFCSAANQQQHQVSQAMTASSSQHQTSSSLPSIPNVPFEQLQRFLVNLQQQHFSNQIFPQSILRAVNQFSPLSAQIRNALASPVNPFPPNAAVLAAAAAQHQRLPAPVPATMRAGTPLSPTAGTSGLQAGKISGESPSLIPSAFTPNIHSSSAAKAAVSAGSFSSSSSDELSQNKSGVRLRQNASQSNLMLPPPFPRSRNPSVALPSCSQQRQRQSALPYQRPPHFASESIPLHSYHPSHFMKGTVIQLQSGQLKRVEDMNTDDFVRSAAMNTDLILCYSTVRDIKNAGKERQVIVTFFVEQKKAEVSIEADIEHPYFVVDQGWASCNPEKTRNSYGLTCRQLQIGDVCIAVYDAGKEEASLSTRTSVSVSAVLTSSSATVAETGGDKVAAEKYDGQGKQQQDDDNKLWRSSIMQPPSSGNISQSSSDGISQVSVRERSEFSN